MKHYHYVIVDNHSGYIWGYTADVNGKTIPCQSAIEAAKVIDESMGEHGRLYEEVSRLASNETGYHIYQVPEHDGKEVVVIQKEQHESTTDPSLWGCELVATVRVFKEFDVTH